MTDADVPAARAAPAGGALATVRRVAGRVDAIWPVLLVLTAWTIWLSPVFAEPAALLGIVQRGAGLAVLAAGQYFVLVSGEFDLSVGSLVTVVVIAASSLMDGDPSTIWWLIPGLVVFGALVGVANGLITTRLGVPSILTTLGMLLILRGAGYQVSGGSPQGALAANFRTLGRDRLGDVPLLGSVPWAAIVVLVVAVVAVLVMRRTDFGARLMAIGSNDTTARFSGVPVERDRTVAFVLSALSAVLAGILIGGFAGETAQAGLGMELQAISAVVLGGVIIGGGQGRVSAAIGGALTLQVLFTLLNLLGLAAPLRAAAQGLILILALAYAGLRTR